MIELSDLSHIIELSVAPVFLLAGIGAFLNVVASRLARIVDRARNLEERYLAGPTAEEMARIKTELGILDQRRVVEGAKQAAVLRKEPEKFLVIDVEAEGTGGCVKI